MNNTNSKKALVKVGHKGRRSSRKKEFRKQQRKLELDKKKEVTRKEAEKYSQKHEVLETIKKSSSVLRSAVASPDDKSEATACLHKTLGKIEPPPVHEILATGLMEHFVNNLTAFPDHDSLIIESLWALAKIAACGHFEEVVEANAVPLLLHLLQPRREKNPLMCELAAWCLGSICQGHSDCREALVAYPGFMKALSILLEESPNQEFMNTIVWTISTILCNGKYDFEHMKPMAGKICFLLKYYSNRMTKDVEAEMVKVLSNISEYSHEQMDFVMETGITATLAGFVGDDPGSHTTVHALKCLGHFAGGSTVQTAEVMETGILHHIDKIMANGSRCAKKECCYLLSNILCDKAEYANAVIKYKALLPRVSNLAKSGPWDVKQEALWALAKMCSQPEEHYCLHVVRCHGFEPLINYLGDENAEAGLLVQVLQAIDRILMVDGKVHHNYIGTFEDYDGPDHLENLQNHKCTAVYKQAAKVLENHFDVISDNEELDEDPAEENVNSSAKDSIKRELFASTTGNLPRGPDSVFAVTSNYH
eukprot:Nitzschia sp. Nitz4//scaffold230_size58257//51871//53554//NITZ4_006489-RA/size58257-augustus-gene-0.6-mRNA-1//1//CDS//3329543274//9428//frame0